MKAKYTRNAAGEIVPVEAGSQPSKPTFVQEKDGFTAGLDEGMKGLPEVKETEAEEIDFTKEGGKIGVEGEYNRGKDIDLGFENARTEDNSNRASAELIRDESVQGGAYKDLATDGFHRHHMPADSISPYSTNEGPAIQMDPKDHTVTKSWGRSKTAKEYRQMQKDLIDKGLFREAQQMDIDDIYELFGGKYNKAIVKMLEYTETLVRKDR